MNSEKKNIYIKTIFYEKIVAQWFFVFLEDRGSKVVIVELLICITEKIFFFFLI